VTGITFLRVTVQWDADASMENGAYGLYPVSSTDVVIDGCVVKGARDAGIYVGQSQGILVANSEAHGNVAGIEIENSTDAIVRDNYAHDNTGGILVFNLPGLPVKDGKRANVFNNRVENNNTDNFGEPGTTVSQVPPGLGMLILASDDNEIHDNEIRGNRSSAIVILSFIEDLFGVYDDPEFDAYPQGNFIHDNLYENNGTDPAGLVSVLTDIRPIPDIMWDGCIDEAAMDDGHLTNCISEPSVTFLSFNFCNDFPAPSQDLTPVTCTYEPLPTE
jgi:parallel beta-helix repeat protein